MIPECRSVHLPHRMNTAEGLKKRLGTQALFQKRKASQSVMANKSS